eukprot:TRINITY_DN15983_c0_g1_i2.p1 TRINITY_DN15983_c0_g1~~TRINITY_DN15983_c0_g1_i2.p1  ORF type:complete len:135 (-),score=32.43 TRINITY_DN15983_c0_g1_i2:63-467(-)
MIRRPPRSTHCISSAASDVYKRQVQYYDYSNYSKDGGLNKYRQEYKLYNQMFNLDDKRKCKVPKTDRDSSSIDQFLSKNQQTQNQFKQLCQMIQRSMQQQVSKQSSQKIQSPFHAQKQNLNENFQSILLHTLKK